MTSNATPDHCFRAPAWADVPRFLTFSGGRPQGLHFEFLIGIGCPAWIRTMTKASKGPCATITPPDKMNERAMKINIMPENVSKIVGTFSWTD
jgi:hypothetical protein